MNSCNYINVKDYGANGDNFTDDTARIQAAFDAAKFESDNGRSATVLIPPGNYLIGSDSANAALVFEANHCKLTGGGTLKHKVGSIAAYLLRIKGNFNTIDWIRVDGNFSNGAAAVHGYRVTGDFNRSRNVFAFDFAPGPTQDDPKGDSLQHIGKAGTMTRCTAVGGYTSLRDAGDFNVIRYCLGQEYHRKGYNNSAENTAWTCVIGVHMESTVTSVEAAAGYQIDPEEESNFQRAIFRDCTGKPDVNTAATANGLKFAVIQDVYLDGCQFLHHRTTVTTLRFAEKVGRIRVKDTFLSREIHIEPGATPPPGYMLLERVIVGDGVQQPVEGIENARCNVLVLNDSTIRNYSSVAIEWQGADGTYTQIAARNCDFSGNLPSNTPPAPPATSDILALSGGQLNRSGKLMWLGNRRTNNGAGGLSRFTNPVVTNELLGTTQDASISVYANTAAPTGSLANWNLGDIIVNTTPTAGGYFGWVCTNPASPPGTWKQWGSIAS
jgi:hypothetical protein